MSIRDELQGGGTHPQHTVAVRAIEEDSVPSGQAGSGAVAASVNPSSMKSLGKAATQTASMSRSASRRQQAVRPLSLPKPTIILPFFNTKPMLIEDSGKIKMVQ